MAGKRRDDVREEDVTGLKYFAKLCSAAGTPA